MGLMRQTSNNCFCLLEQNTCIIALPLILHNVVMEWCNGISKNSAVQVFFFFFNHYHELNMACQ